MRMDVSKLGRDLVISQNEAVVSILAGLGIMLVGVLNKTFYAGRDILAASTSSKRIPTWLGRLLFLVGGGVFLVTGIYYFISKAVSE
jgi:hypothetical protein